VERIVLRWTIVSDVNYIVVMKTAPSDDQVIVAASQVRAAVTRLARTLRRESATDLSPTLMIALATIEAHGPMTPGDLASHERVRKPTVTRILGALAERGLVERTPDPLDGRMAWIQLTPDGRKLLRRVRRRRDEFLGSRMRALTPSELSVLERATSILDRLAGGERARRGTAPSAVKGAP
jgi:DNA-binding MarR family transcriptional regulator